MSLRSNCKSVFITMTTLPHSRLIEIKLLWLGVESIRSDRISVTDSLHVTRYTQLTAPLVPYLHRLHFQQLRSHLADKSILIIIPSALSSFVDYSILRFKHRHVTTRHDTTHNLTTQNQNSVETWSFLLFYCVSIVFGLCLAVKWCRLSRLSRLVL